MQNLHSWLDMPKNKGRAVQLAELLGVDKSAVSLWRGNGVPMRHMQAIVKFTKGKVTLTGLVLHAAACREANAKARAAATAGEV